MARFRRLAVGFVLAVLPTASCSTSRVGDPADPSAALEAGDHRIELRHDGRDRSFLVHVPAARPGDGLPVVIAFHGGGGNAAGYKAYAGFDGIADREDFAAVYLDGTGQPAGRLLTWNAGGCCGYAMDRDVDDVAFTIAILDYPADRGARARSTWRRGAVGPARSSSECHCPAPKRNPWTRNMEET